MSDGPVKYESEGNVAVITMDDGKANALSYAMMDAVEEALKRAIGEASAVVLTGRVGRFCAGFDLREMASGMEQARALVTRGASYLMNLYQHPQPLVVACSGHALAGGALTVLTGDVRIGAPGAFKIGLNEVQIGMPVPILAMELARDRLERKYHTAATLFGQVVDPATALEWGYLDRLEPAESLRHAAVAEAAKLGAISSSAYAKTKAALRERTVKYVQDTVVIDMQRLTPPAG
jgi:enoyl-CoA hydratase